MAVILIFISGGHSLEKVGTTSFQFLKVQSSARFCAMGEASSSIVNDAQSVFFNPAGLVFVQKLSFSADYLDWLLDISHLSLSAAYRVQGLGTFALFGMMTDIGEIKVTEVNSLGFVNEVYLGYTGETITPGAMVFGLSFARRITDKFSFGISGKFAREDLAVKTTQNFMFDGGLIYETGFRSLKIAASIMHFGPDVKYYDEVMLERYIPTSDSIYYQKYSGKSFPLPQTFSIGASGYIMNSESSLFFNSEQQSLLVSFDLVQPRDYDQQYHLGLEYGYQNILFLRAGYKLNYDEESFSLGFGVGYSGYKFDYAYSDFGQYLDSVHRFSVGISLP